jgi:hypothetical protein
MRSTFQLSTFLYALESDGIRLNVRDYVRIQRVLGCDDGWTLDRLRDVLLALLAKDATQRELVGRRFDAFFDADIKGPATRQVDLAEIRAELQAFFKGRAAPRVKPRSPMRLTPVAPVAALPDPRRWQRLALYVSLAGLVVGLLIAGWIITHPDTPQLHITPPDHVLAAAPQNEEVVEFTVRNTGKGQLTVKQIELSPPGGFFDIQGTTCQDAGAALKQDGQCLVTIVFAPQTQGRYEAKLDVQSDTGRLSASLVGRCETVKQAPTADPDNLDQLPAVIVAPRSLVIQERLETPIAGSVPWQQTAMLSAFFLVLTFVFGWYLIKARKPPDDRVPEWDASKPRHFPLEKVGGAPAPRLDDETLTHLADSMGYFRSLRAGRRPDIDASVLATVENGGIPRLIFQRGKELRHLIVLEDGRAGEAQSLNPIAAELRAGMRRHGVALISGRFYGDPAEFHAESGRALYLEDLEANRRAFLLLIFSDGCHRGMRHTLEQLMRWPHVAWFDLRAPETRDASAALPARYGIPVYSATTAGLLQAFARFLSEIAPQADAAKDAASGQGLPPRGEMPLAAYLETLLGDALPWAQACAMAQPVGPGLADGLRREFYGHLPPDRLERLAVLPGTTRSAAGFRFSDAVLAELRRGFARRHPSTGRAAPQAPAQGLPRQEAVLGFILREMKKSWTREVRENPNLADSPAQLAWEKHYRQVELELDPDAALPRLAELAQTPLENTIRADFEKAVLPGDDATEKAPAGVPLRQAPDKTDNLQRLARIADKSGIPILRAYPLKWWHRVLAVFLITGLLATAGWSAWAYRHGRDLRPTIKVAGGPDMHVKATLERRESGEWQKVVTRTGLPFQIEVAPGSDYRLVPYGDDKKQLLVSEEFRNLRQNLAVQWAAEEAAAAAEAEGLGYLVVTNDKRDVLRNHKVTVRNALFSQTVDADQTLHLAPGQWQVRVEADAAPPDTEGPSSVSGSAWLTVDVEAGKKTYQEVATEAYFRDRLKGGGYGPQMVSIPAGSFTMGSPESEPGHDSDEGPQHGVTLKAFAIGRYEVTFDAYDAFCEATDREKPDDEDGAGAAGR